MQTWIQWEWKRLRGWALLSRMLSKWGGFFNLELSDKTKTTLTILRTVSKGGLPSFCWLLVLLYIYMYIFFPSKFLRLFSRRPMLINCWNFTPEKAFDGRRFINYMIRIFEVMSMDFCDSMCLWNLTVSALILINEWRKTNKKDHYFDHPADIGVASLANTHLWKKWKKFSEIFITICR